MTKKLSAPLILTVLVVGKVYAVDTYSNLNALPGYNAGYAYFVNPTQLNKGWQFTATASGTLSGFKLALNNDKPSDGHLGFTLDLHANNGSTGLGPLLGSYSGLSTGKSLYTNLRRCSLSARAYAR